MRKNRIHHDRDRRTGAVAVTVAVAIPVVIAFAALSVDVGVMYNAKADLQRAADAAAMAAASRLTSLVSGDPVTLGRQAARDTAHANPVLNQAPQLTDSDIVFGTAKVNPFTQAVTFTPTENVPNAVRVTVRKTADSPNGPLPLYFARIFGRDSTNVQATATAAVAPRDIALVSDVSGSLVYDSTFRRWESVKINIYDVWNELPGGAGEVGSTWGPGEELADPAQSAGPAWGFFKHMGFGDDPADQSNYSVDGDPGLIKLQKSTTWSNAELESFLYAQNYSAAEVAAILSPANDGSYYENRVALALGLATWNSGISGGRWQTLGLPSQGNGNTIFGSSEMQWQEPFLSTPANQAESIWRDYIDRYSRSSSPFRYQYGIKTMLDYTLEYRRSESQTPELADVPVQPMEAVKEATKYMIDLLINALSFDQISLELYSSAGTHAVDLTHNFAEVTAVLDDIVPSGTTNMGQGMERGIDELTSTRARGEARKILLVITDGQANVDRTGRSSVTGGKQYAVEEAERAAALGIQIISISVGQDSDQELMAQIAEIGKGVHFHAEGSIEEYESQLLEIFAAVGGRRTVSLIE